MANQFRSISFRFILKAAHHGRTATCEWGLRMSCRRAESGFQIVAGYPQIYSSANHSERGRSGGMRGLLDESEPSKRIPQWTTLCNLYRGGNQGVVRSAGPVTKVNLIAMLSWSFEFEGKDYFEGFRTLATNGVDKPVLNVFRMAGMMSGERVKAISSGPCRSTKF